MSSKIISLLNQLEDNEEDFQRSYKYNVDCPRLYWSLNGKSYNLNKFITECTIPTKNIEFETQHLTHIPNKVSPYSDFQVTFRETTDMAVKNCIENWQGSIVNINDYFFPPFLARDTMVIQTLDLEDTIKSTNILIDVVPKKIDEIKLGEGQNEILLQSVTFTVRKVIPKELLNILDGSSFSSLVTLGIDSLATV